MHLFLIVGPTLLGGQNTFDPALACVSVMSLARCVYLVYLVHYCKPRKYLVYRQIRSMLVGNHPLK